MVGFRLNSSFLVRFSPNYPNDHSYLGVTFTRFCNTNPKMRFQKWKTIWPHCAYRAHLPICLLETSHFCGNLPLSIWKWNSRFLSKHSAAVAAATDTAAALPRRYRRRSNKSYRNVSHSPQGVEIYFLLTCALTPPPAAARGRRRDGDAGHWAVGPARAESHFKAVLTSQARNSFHRFFFL